MKPLIGFAATPPTRWLSACLFTTLIAAGPALAQMPQFVTSQEDARPPSERKQQTISREDDRKIKEKNGKKKPHIKTTGLEKPSHKHHSVTLVHPVHPTIPSEPQDAVEVLR